MRTILTSTLLLCLLALPALSDTILDDFQVNSNFPGHPPQQAPYAVADWETETIYLTWLSQHDGVNWDVAFNRFNYDLEPLGDASYLNIRQDDADCKQPRLVLSDDGFGAAWIAEGTPNQPRFRSFDNAGNPLCYPTNIVDNTLNVTRDSLSIAALDDGYMLVWYDERDSSKVWAQMVDFDGNLNGDNFPIRPDSTGSILGLEAQNHPDGRVLVSWVVDGMYSRARWLDAEGQFLTDVFEIQDATITGEVANSMIRFGTDGLGMLLQHSAQFLQYARYAYITKLDSSAASVSDPEQSYYWSSDSYESSDLSYWPSLICTDNYHYVRTQFYWVWFTMQGSTTYTYNYHYSSVDSITTYATWTNNSYHLCLLNEDYCLYSFSTGYLGLEKLDIMTVEPVDTVAWLYEPDWDQEQNTPDIIAHIDGSFRIVYNSRIGAEERLFSRYFDVTGMPSSAEVLVSMDESLSTIHTIGGRIEKTSTDDALVFWLGEGVILGTTYEGSVWAGQVEEYDCEESVGQFIAPECDIDAQDHVLLVWEEDWWDHTNSSYYGTLHAQSFQNLFEYFGSQNSITAFAEPQYTEFRCALKDDGRFVISYRSPITLQMGQNYYELVGDPIQLSNIPNGPFQLEDTEYGYVIAVVADSVIVQQLDTDGNPVGDPITISDSTAIATGTPDLAVSQSGNFAVCWQDARFDAGDIFCRQFNADGSFYGYEYRVNSDPVGPLQKEPAVAFGPNDQLYFTWTDFRNEGNQGDIYCKVIEWIDATAVEPEPEPVPLSFALHPPYPNPFNPTTILTFTLPVASEVALQVFDVQGRDVLSGSGTTPTPGLFSSGTHSIQFDGSDLASGIYFVRLEAGDFSAMQKIVLLK